MTMRIIDADEVEQIERRFALPFKVKAKGFCSFFLAEELEVIKCQNKSG
jgi:hypothetical protein